MRAVVRAIMLIMLLIVPLQTLFLLEVAAFCAHGYELVELLHVNPPTPMCVLAADLSRGREDDALADLQTTEQQNKCNNIIE